MAIGIEFFLIRSLLVNAYLFYWLQKWDRGNELKIFDTTKKSSLKGYDRYIHAWYLLEILLRTFDKLCINALYALCQWKENYFGKVLINAKHKSDSLLHRNIDHRYSATKM